MKTAQVNGYMDDPRYLDYPDTNEMHFVSSFFFLNCIAFQSAMIRVINF